MSAAELQQREARPDDILVYVTRLGSYRLFWQLISQQAAAQLGTSACSLLGCTVCTVSVISFFDSRFITLDDFEKLDLILLLLVL